MRNSMRHSGARTSPARASRFTRALVAVFVFVLASAVGVAGADPERGRDRSRGSSSSSEGKKKSRDERAQQRGDGSSASSSSRQSSSERRSGSSGSRSRGGSANSDPAGNNGTIKVDGEAFDSHPNNEPHPGCTFQIDFYNYDKGDHFADLSFDLISPTDGPVLLTDRVFIGEDAAGGGRDLDASTRIYLGDVFAQSGTEPHPKQGYHVKLTIHADGSIGSDVKHKVFWVQCAPVTGGEEGGVAPGEGEGQEGGVAPGEGEGEEGDVAPGEGEGEEGADVLGARAARLGAEVLGLRVTRGPVLGANTSRDGVLASTGLSIAIATAAALLLSAGSVMLIGTRRRKGL